MTKKAVEEIADELTILADYEQGENSFPEFIWRLLASFPGGDEAEDMGFEPLVEHGMSWYEGKLVYELMNALETTQDVEALIELMREDDDDDD